MTPNENYQNDQMTITYEQTGQSTNTDAQGMLEMQARLLIISTSSATRQSKATALARNRYICEQADTILFVSVTEHSSLYPLKQEYDSKSTTYPITSIT
jgi:methionine synthase I (cobalamin-dependent)